MALSADSLLLERKLLLRNWHLDLTAKPVTYLYLYVWMSRCQVGLARLSACASRSLMKAVNVFCVSFLQKSFCDMERAIYGSLCGNLKSVGTALFCYPGSVNTSVNWFGYNSKFALIEPSLLQSEFVIQLSIFFAFASYFARYNSPNCRRRCLTQKWWSSQENVHFLYFDFYNSLWVIAEETVEKTKN